MLRISPTGKVLERCVSDSRGHARSVRLETEMDSDHVGARILIVDDDKSTAKALQYALGVQGYETKVVYTGEAAMTAISEWPPDLLMLDVKLPDVDGLELLSRFRAEEETSATPVILITASRKGSPSRVKGLNLGADDYIEKPFGLLEQDI